MFWQEIICSHACCSGVFDGKSWTANGEWADAVAPATGEVMARVRMGTVQDLQRCTQAALDARADWAAIPAPRRGEIVRKFGNNFREVRLGCKFAVLPWFIFRIRTLSHLVCSFQWRWARSLVKGAAKSKKWWTLLIWLAA
jgi:hypothetical protein